MENIGYVHCCNYFYPFLHSCHFSVRVINSGCSKASGESRLVMIYDGLFWGKEIIITLCRVWCFHILEF